jgi:Trypsin-like peptidase domain
MKSLVVLSLAVGMFQAPSAVSQNFPASTQALLKGVKNPKSKGVIKAVLMIVCPKDTAKGTGFALTGGGIITTNSHVVGSCRADELVGVSAVTPEPVKFTKMERDPNRDLALLCAEKPLPFSLELNGDENPPVETEVETWGYPLRYQDPAPVLSRGYVAGYTLGKDANGKLKNPAVKHLIVNGALNPGNSGGPLIDRLTGKVIGIVVEKWTLWSPLVEIAIQGFSHPAGTITGTFSRVNAQGQREDVSDQAVLASVLREFYDVSQVMVGEAISVSELNAFVKDKRKGMTCESH